jgi:hypothetical protein
MHLINPFPLKKYLFFSNYRGHRGHRGKEKIGNLGPGRE